MPFFIILPSCSYECIDLFAGCGGLSLGFEQAGFEVCAAFEKWEKAIDIYRKNFNHPVYDTDLTKKRQQFHKF